MYVEPNTNIRILKNCPLDNTYDHTIYFADRNEQVNYFQSLTKHSLTRQSYQRVKRGWMRVNLNAETLYDCNYCMFQNASFGSKWFYAFIKSVEYINNDVSEIEFEIDVMQSWYFDYHLDICFVEREHSKTDVLFENIVDEDLDSGSDYISHGLSNMDFSDLAIAILSSTDSEGNAWGHGDTIRNVYSGLSIDNILQVLPETTDDSEIQEYLENGYADSIVNLYMFPSKIAVEDSGDFNVEGDFTKLGNYTPRNKKLFTYPYNVLLVSNNQGQTAEYKWENWNVKENTGKFEWRGTYFTTPCILLFPRFYRGITDDYDSGLTLSNFPVCAWTGDVYKAYMAQNKGSISAGQTASALSAITQGTVGVAMVASALATGGTTALIGGAGAIVSGGVSAFNSVNKLEGKKRDLQATPPTIHGQTQTESLNASMGRFKFSAYSLCIKEEYAKIIDDYFDRFGYATRRNKIPETNARPHWTYTKTIGCTITGSIPADDARAICHIYDNGITFWRRGQEVGNYGLDNRV